MDRTIGSRARAAIAVGSNLGDRRAALDFAIDRLSRLLGDLNVSTVIETEPLDRSGAVVEDQPRFLNAVVTGLTTLDPHALLDALLAIEADFGRERPYPGAPRTLDVDLVLLGDRLVDDARLQLPHPRFRDREFVLGPLAEIAPDLRDPVTGMTVGELLRALGRR